MISTAAPSFLHKPVTPQGVDPAQSTDGAPAQDFAAMISRLYSSKLSVATLTQSAAIPDTGSKPAEDDPSPKDDKVSAARDSRTPERPKRRDPLPGPEASQAPTAAQPDQTTTPLPKVEKSGTDKIQPTEVDAAAAPAPSLPTQPGDGRVTAPADHSAAQPVTQATQSTLQPKDTQAQPGQPAQPQRGPVQDNNTTNPNASLPKAQIVDGAAQDQLPQLGHMLSGRAAVVAQSDVGKGGLPADNGGGLKNDPAQQAAASVAGTAAQPGAGAAGKAKGQTQPGNTSTNNPQGANGAQGGQTGAQAAGQTATAATLPQPNFNGALSANADDAGQPGTQTPLPSRGDPISLTGTTQLGQPSNLRGPEAAAAPKPATPLPPRLIANQVAVQIQKAVGDGNDRISIQLKPAELGKVEVRLDVASDGRVSAVITAHRADTLDLLQRDARILQNALQDAGLQADSNSLSFELKGNGLGYGGDGGNSSGTGSSNGAAIDDVTAATATAARARPSIVSNDRVDIHV
jgi:flagellar hook-length control protein FliK